MLKRTLFSDTGNALLLAVGAVFIISLLIIGVLARAVDNSGRGRIERSKVQAAVVAESALNEMTSIVLNNGSNFANEWNPDIEKVAGTPRPQPSANGTPGNNVIGDEATFYTGPDPKAKLRCHPQTPTNGVGAPGVVNQSIRTSCSVLDIGGPGASIDPATNPDYKDYAQRLTPSDLRDGEYWSYVSGAGRIRTILAYGRYSVDVEADRNKWRTVSRTLKVRIVPRVSQMAVWAGRDIRMQGALQGYISSDLGASASVGAGRNFIADSGSTNGDLGTASNTSLAPQINWKAGHTAGCATTPPSTVAPYGYNSDFDEVLWFTYGKLGVIIPQSFVGVRSNESFKHACDPRSNFKSQYAGVGFLTHPYTGGMRPTGYIPGLNNGAFSVTQRTIGSSHPLLFLTEKPDTTGAREDLKINGATSAASGKYKMPFWQQGTTDKQYASDSIDAPSCVGVCLNFRRISILPTSPDFPLYSSGGILGQPDPSDQTADPVTGTFVWEARRPFGSTEVLPGEKANNVSQLHPDANKGTVPTVPDVSGAGFSTGPPGGDAASKNKNGRSPRDDTYYDVEEFQRLLNDGGSAAELASMQTIYVANRKDISATSTGIERSAAESRRLPLTGIKQLSGVYLPLIVNPVNTKNSDVGGLGLAADSDQAACNIIIGNQTAANTLAAIRVGRSLIIEGCNLIIDKGYLITSKRFVRPTNVLGISETDQYYNREYPGLLVLRNTDNVGGNLIVNDSTASQNQGFAFGRNGTNGFNGLLYTARSALLKVSQCPDSTQFQTNKPSPNITIGSGSIMAGKDVIFRRETADASKFGCYLVGYNYAVQSTRFDWTVDGGFGTYSVGLNGAGTQESSNAYAPSP